MRPGRVIEVLGSGNVKVEAPGLFSREDIEALPTVMPWFGLHANSYSEPMLEDEVWVLNLADNPQQLFWFRKDDRTEHNQDLEGETNVEILCNREAGAGYATIYFSDNTGWMFRNGESFINIDSGGNIILDNSNIVVHLNGGQISLGSKDQSAHPIAFGDKTQECIDQLCDVLTTIKNACTVSPLTVIAGAISVTPEKIKSLAESIPSKKVTAD